MLGARSSGGSLLGVFVGFGFWVLIVSKHENLDYDGRLKMLSNAMIGFSSFMKNDEEGNLA